MKNIIQFYSLSVLNFWWSKIILGGGQLKRKHPKKKHVLLFRRGPKKRCWNKLFLLIMMINLKRKMTPQLRYRKLPQKQPLAQRFNTRRAFCGFFSSASLWVDQGKAKAFDKLAAFYDACAQVEIDEYRDYDKVCCLMWLDGWLVGWLVGLAGWVGWLDC